MKHNKRWISTLLPVLAGFLALYLAMMALATFLIQETFMETFEKSYTSMVIESEGAFIDHAEGNQWLEQESAELLSYDLLMNSLLNRGVSKYYQCSCALFDEDNNLLFQSKNFLSFLRVDEPMGEILFPADDYLSPEELREFASLVYQYQTHLPGRSGYLSSQEGASPEGASPEGASPEEYAHKHWRISLVLAKETNIPVRLTVQELNLNGEEHEDSDETGEAHEAVDETEEALEIADETGKTDEVPEAVDETASDADTRSPSAPEDSLSFSDVPWDHSTVVWVWQNPDIRISGEPQEQFYEAAAVPGSSFPYLSYGYEDWLAWQENEFLQDLQPDTELFYPMPDADGSLPFRPQTKRAATIHVPLYGKDWGRCSFVAAVDCHPWLAAMDSLKYFYLFGFACMLLCTGILTFCICRTNQRREALEEYRRTLTHTMAHNLKTPLREIRGFTEHLQQNAAAETQEYDLDQIILKTEEIDSLAVEMINLSRSESGMLIPEKEPSDAPPGNHRDMM